MPIALIVHGGAWAIPDDEAEAHRAGCRAAREAGWRVLEQGGSALDAVETAIRLMEDDPAFDAGVGSVLNRDGAVELDAAIMEGARLRCGAVAAVRRVRNPITLARRVLESQSVLLAAEGAERFAEASGVPLCDPAELVVERERARWVEFARRSDFRAQDAFVARPGDTVGAVALDRQGRLAAGASTGGTANKPPGRVGDTPLIGCGLYADDQIGGCASTGWGESLIKVVLAKTAIDLLGANGDPMAAARAAIDRLAQRVGGLGGCILLDTRGRAGLAFNTPRMAYAYRDAGGRAAEGI